MNDDLSIAKQTVRTAIKELIKRGFDMQAWQAENLRNLSKPNEDFESEDMTPAQRERFDRLSQGKTTRKKKIVKKGGKISPGIGRGRQHINSGGG